MKKKYIQSIKQPSHISTISYRIAVIFLLSLSTTISLAEESHAFLITGSNSKINTVSKHDLRRIYLGGSAIDTLEIENPILNKSDTETYNLFLKNIMHMTEHGYKRKVIKRIFRQGSNKLIEINTLNELDTHLKNNPNDICFISDKYRNQMLNIKIIKKLW